MRISPNDIENIKTELLWRDNGGEVEILGIDILYHGMPIYTVDIDEEELMRIVSSGEMKESKKLIIACIENDMIDEALQLLEAIPYRRPFK